MSTTAGHQDGSKIRLMRKNRGLSVRELADQIGVHSQSLRNVELGRRASLDMLLKVARGLGVELPVILRNGSNGNGPGRAA